MGVECYNLGALEDFSPIIFSVLFVHPNYKKEYLKYFRVTKNKRGFLWKLKIII